MRKLMAALGVCIAIVSAFFAVAAIGDLVWGGSPTRPGILLGMLVFFLGTGMAGVWLARQNLRRPAGSSPTASDAPTTTQEREHRILQLARQQHGRVTVAEVAEHCQITLHQSKEALDRAVLEGAAAMEVTEGGVLVYEYAGFLSDDERDSAKDL